MMLPRNSSELRLIPLSSLSSQIEDRAKSAESHETDEEKVHQLTQERDEASKKYTDTLQEIDKLKTERDTLEREIYDLDSKHALAKAMYDRNKPTYEERMADYESEGKRVKAALPPAGLDPRNIKDFILQQAQIIQKAANEYDAWKLKLDALADDEANLAQQLKQKQDRFKKLNGYTSRGVTHKGLIETKQDEAKLGDPTVTPPVDSLEKKMKDAEKDLKEAIEGSKDGKKKAEALLDFKNLNNSSMQGDIINEIVTANNNDFSIDKLTNLSERAPGQIEGMERMRELIFKTLKKDKYDADLARKMLPDEAIAKAIVWVLKLDIKKVYTPGPPPISIETHMDTLQPLQADLQTLKHELHNLETATPRVQADIDAKKAEITAKHDAITAAGHDFGKMILPELKKRTRFERGELVKFIMEQGILASAHQEDPYLNLNDFDDRIRTMQTEIFNTEGEIFDESRFGHTKITEEKISWNDTINRPGASRTGSNLDITYQVDFMGGEKDNEGRLMHQVGIKTDQHLLERFPLTLPTIRPTWMTEEMAKLFYTKDGRFRTEYKYSNGWWRIGRLKTKELKIPAYVEAQKINSSDSADAMSVLRTEIPGSEQKIPKSVGYAVLYDLTPEQRLARLRGMDSKLMGIALAPPPGADTSKLTIPPGTLFSIEFNNEGEITIQQTATGETKSWNMFFKDVRNSYKGATLAAGHTERGDLQEYLDPLLDRLGRAALDAKKAHI